MSSSALCSYHRVAVSGHPLPSSPSPSLLKLFLAPSVLGVVRGKRSPASSNILWGESLHLMGSEGGMHRTYRRPRREDLQLGELRQASQKK